VPGGALMRRAGDGVRRRRTRKRRKRRRKSM
jgi:hypothetical protein